MQPAIGRCSTRTPHPPPPPHTYMEPAREERKVEEKKETKIEIKAIASNLQPHAKKIMSPTIDLMR